MDYLFVYYYLCTVLNWIKIFHINKYVMTIILNVLSWLDHKFDLIRGSFFLYSALKVLSKTKFSLEWQTRRCTDTYQSRKIEN